MISAQEGTKPIFDSDKLPTHFWARSEDVAACVADYLDWFDRYVEVGPLVTKGLSREGYYSGPVNVRRGW